MSTFDRASLLRFKRRQRILRRMPLALRVLAGVVVVVVLLMTPSAETVPTGLPRAQPFRWNQASLWNELELRFAERQRDCGAAEGALRRSTQELQGVSDNMTLQATIDMEPRVFDAATTASACPNLAPTSDFLRELIAYRQRVREASRNWSIGSEEREGLYRILYGTRMAIEEVMLSRPDPAQDALHVFSNEPADVPGTVAIRGVSLRSGDLLLSRGDAPTSALIARASDHPGNFSHVALVHIAQDGEVSTVEAHIESGVVVAPAAKYFEGEKLRVLVLRPRVDSATAARVAEEALQRAQQRHIAYDFAMNDEDDETLYCSEVGYSAYQRAGIDLWPYRTAISESGVAQWMADLGVRYFDILGPSDLEYDPQVEVVAEWHDVDRLLDDHVHNAVVDALLETARREERLRVPPYKLPLFRLAKAYSVVATWLGASGPIPEGMDASAAGRVEELARRFEEVRRRTLEKNNEYARRNGRPAPYFRLVDFAQDAAR